MKTPKQRGKIMAKWTTHCRYTFHAENCTGIGLHELLEEIEYLTGMSTMVKEYTGVWQGDITPGYEITWIAPHTYGEEEAEATFQDLSGAIKHLTGNQCLMPTRENVQVYCECR